MEEAPVPVELDGVPETMLWPLWNRAAEQQRKDRLIDDPLAAELAARLDFDFPGHFGKPNVLHVVRARVGDDLISRYLTEYPMGTIIALGEGPETQFWRVANAGCRWLSVDVPAAASLRHQMLPADPRLLTIEGSALD